MTAHSRNVCCEEPKGVVLWNSERQLDAEAALGIGDGRNALSREDNGVSVDQQIGEGRERLKSCWATIGEVSV